MKLRMIMLAVAAATLAVGFYSAERYQVSEQGCAGSGCHTYKPGFISLKKQENLGVKVIPQFTAKKSPLTAELISVDGKMVDFQNVAAERSITLRAPKPGKYKVIVGYRLAEPAWDSLWVTLAPSIINIPTSRYGTSSFKFFPIHPKETSREALLRFVLPENDRVRITLFTAGGRKVNSIFEGYLNKGLHEIRFETRDASRRLLDEGSYLCEIRTSTKQQVQRLNVKR